MYKLLPLPYAYQDLEPYIDTHTMAVHYQKHAKGYLNKLNTILTKNNYNYQYTLPQLINHINEFPEQDREDLLFNLGGVLNHNLYFRSMSPDEERNATGELNDKIIRHFGSIENFKQELKKKALSLKGAGFTSLVVKPDQSLALVNTHNQETPLSLGYIPLLNLDMWEHAYYLNYKNEKEQYINNFLDIMDFKNASKIYDNLKES